MNEILKAKVIQAWADVETAKRRYAEATTRHSQPQQAIEDYRKSHAYECARQTAEQQAIRLRWEAEANALATSKRQREAQYVEEQRKVKREFDEAESALAKAQRASVRAERELAEDAEDTRLKKEREDKRRVREEEKELGQLVKDRARMEKIEQREARDWNNRAL